MASENVPHVVPFPQSATADEKPQQSRTSETHAREPESLSELLSYDGDEPASTRKAILAIAYLLEWGSEMGGDPLHGQAASGLSYLLRKCATDVDRFYTIDESIAAGADAKALIEAKSRRAR